MHWVVLGLFWVGKPNIYSNNNSNRNITHLILSFIYIYILAYILMLLICDLELSFRSCCLTFTLLSRCISQTDKTGCASHIIMVSAFAPREQRYQDMVPGNQPPHEVEAEMQEHGTGRFMNEWISCLVYKARHCQCWCQIMTVACLFCRGGHSSQWPNTLLCWCQKTHISECCRCCL